MSLETNPRARVITSRRPVRQRVGQIWEYRDLLVGMVRKELKVKYKNSVLGFVWSMLNPALYLVVFYIVFQLVLGSGIPNFAIYLLSGLLVWNLFSTALSSATTSITSNAPLIQKVYFPREILPLASIGASLVHFFLQTLVLFGAIIVFRYESSPAHATMLLPALVALLIMTAGLAIFLAAANVYLRDVQHLLELVLLTWFWMTPIVYQFRLVSDRLNEHAWVAYLNPLTNITLVFQRAVYNRVDAVENDGRVIEILPETMDASWYLLHVGGIALGGFLFLLGALWMFGRLEGNFAEEL